MGSLFFFFHGWGFCLAGSGDRALHSPPPGHVLDIYHPVSGMGWSADLHRGRSHSGCGPAAALRFKLSRAAVAFTNWNGRSSIILRPETTKNWDCCISTTAILPAPGPATTRPSRREPTPIDPFYRRGIAEIELGDFASAVPDLERAVAADPNYDFQRAKGLLAHAYAQTGQAEKADALFQQATKTSTSSETYYNYASFLHAQGRNEEAWTWAQKILDKRPTMPAYQRRRERPWFRKAYALLASTEIAEQVGAQLSS